MPAQITPLPTPVPTRQDPANFAARGDAFLSALPTFGTEANALAVDVSNSAAAAAASVTQAAGHASQSASSAAAAAASQAAAAASASTAESSASSAINSPGTNATSTTSLALGTGSKTLTVQTAKLFVVGQPVMVAATAAPGTQWMAGNVTAYNSGTGSLTVNVVWSVGTGTLSAWTISLAGPANPNALSKTGDTATGPVGIPELVSVISTATTAVKFRTYVLTASLTLTLPASPSAGDWVTVQNSSGTTTAVIARNGQNIMSLAENLTLDADFVAVTLVYADATRGWVFA